LYACGFRIYCTPLPGFFSPFPHGTGSLSVDHEYLALEDGPPIFRQDFTCPALLLSRLVPHRSLQVRGSHPLRPPFPERSPAFDAKSRRLLRFRSPLLSESRLISLPPATEMFQFTGFALPDLCIQPGVTLAQSTLVVSTRVVCLNRLLCALRAHESRLSKGRVSPFGHLRINARLPAPRSFSQAATSFIACDRQGIHHMHLVA
jgi:hypothetical protein